jgi:methyltransferase
MGLSVYLYLCLLAGVGLLRVVELRISRRHQERMLADGAVRVPEPHFKWIVVVHTGVLVGAALEVVLLKRPFLPVLGTLMFVLFLASNLVRLWVVLALGQLWSVQVMDSTQLGVVTTGPFRFVRHPNYTGVILEMISLPLIHTAWITAAATSAAYSMALSLRVRAEERVLMANPEYRAKMGQKPRFLPGLF